MDQNNKKEDLNGAFRGFGSGVQFQEEEWLRPTRSAPETPKIIQLVIKYSGGLVKDEKQANYVLLGFVALAVIISLFLVFNLGGSGVEGPIPNGTSETVSG